LGCFLRVAASASVYDIMLVFGIGCILDLRQNDPTVPAIRYFLSYMPQGAKRNCTRVLQEVGSQIPGVLDGLLIWTNCPTESDAALAKCSIAKFFCGCKYKYGLNMQAICNARGWFLEVSVMYPASTSDVLSFESSSLYRKLEMVY
jgi:DDE superfamily endonuclease